MGATDLIFKLRNDGYSIVADGGFLDIFPADGISLKLVEQIKKSKPEILCLLHRETEIRRLVNLVADYHKFSQADREEALHYALLDQVNALICFTSLARQAELL